VQRERNKTDAQIMDDVLQELKADTRIGGREVDVELDQGVVTLSGTVDSYAVRIAAIEAAHRVAGVLDVADDIQVQVPGPGPGDTEIAQAVRQALEWDVLVPDERIEVTVSEGSVLLKGEVDFYGEKEDAERAIQRLSGVRRVINQLKVREPSATADEIKESIEGALERRASQITDRIKVSVQSGKASLAGFVASRAERTAIVDAARYTPGVQHVEDNLVMEPRF
jgi:osmotically-inducible protein OsmY